MKRRPVVAGVPVALLLGGCTDVLSGDEVRFEADTAIVSEAALSESDYEEVRVETQSQERNFEQVDRTVVVVNSVAEYSRSVSLGPVGGELARFTVLASPSVEVGPVGPLNPIDDMDDRELAETFQEQYGGVDDVEEVGSREVTFLGRTVSTTKFDATARTGGGEEVDVYIHLAKTDSEDDLVVAIGMHPQDVDEEDAIDGLVEGVEHPASAE